MMLKIDFETLKSKANRDSEFLLTGRYWDARVQIVIGAEATELLIAAGKIVATGAASTLGSDLRPIRISGAEQDWVKLLMHHPPAGWHNVSMSGHFAVEGGILDTGPYNAAIRRLIDLMREQVSGPAPASKISNVDRLHDDAVGRYIYVEIQGVQYRIYYEETGSGIPILLQHTAGADGRQWRHVLEDPDYQREFRMISYDLPFHGKSVPPTSVTWWAQEYKLTKAFLMDTVVAISEALGLDRPAFMGCSIGGLLAPDLAFYHPDEFRAVIGINAALGMPGMPNGEVNEQVNSWFHPRVGNDSKASSMLGVMSPTSPEPYQRETAWVYSQGAPPVFKGDIYYYSIDHDLTAEQARQIDTDKVGVYLLTGEYDPLAISGGTKELAACIPAAKYQIIPGAGHFGPSENPRDFKSVLGPVLKEIAARV